MLRDLAALTILVSTITIAHTAHAAPEEEDGPRLGAALVVEWQNEYTSHSNDPLTDETNNSFLRAELAPVVPIGRHFYVDGVIVFEPFDQAAGIHPGDDKWFEREGAFVENLKLNFEYDDFAAWAGKFNPSFGVAWDYGRGIWSEDFAEDYEVTEKLGLGAAYTFGSETMGSHTLAANLFQADTSFLSGGTITHRDRTTRDDGGASNTDGLSSYTVSLDGENALGVANLSYHLGYRHLDEQDENRTPDTDSESGYAAAVGYVWPVSERFTLDMLTEYVSLEGFEGVRNADRRYYSGSAKGIIDERWNITAGYTYRDVRDDGTGAESGDHLFQLSGGYDFQNGFTAEAGWRNTEENTVDTDILGFLIRYQIEF